MMTQQQAPFDYKAAEVAQTQMIANLLSDEYAALCDKANDLADAYAQAPVTQEGVYKAATGVYFRVRWNQSKTNLYAEVITQTTEGITFTYQSGAIFNLNGNARLTADECEALGLLFGRCVLCGRALTVKKSVLQGMGPVCRKRYDD